MGHVSKAAEGTATAADGTLVEKGPSQKAKAAIAEAWMEGSDVGGALVAVSEFFGEPMLPYFWPGRLADVWL